MLGSAINRIQPSSFDAMLLWALGGTFAAAAVLKVNSLPEIEATIAGARLLPDSWIKMASISLIFAEALISLGLAIRWSRRCALHGAALLGGLFFGFSLWRWHQDLKVPCNCFGILLQLNPIQSMFFTLILCSAALKLIRDFPLRLDSIATVIRS